MNLIADSHLNPQRSRSGIALVITLLLLVLLSAFAVAFFTRMSVEQVSAASYSDGVTTRQLAESAVGLVQSQIREATTVPNAAWASQPGMVRNYAKADTSTGATVGTLASPNAYGYYKLYSSNDMTLTGSARLDAFDPAAEIDPEWAKQRALWTDLNEPVRLRMKDPADETREIEVKRYPILDPNLASDSDMTSPSTLSIHNTTRQTKIEGFSIDSKDETTDNARGRMPVRWLYVLRDGTLTAPNAAEDDGLTAKWDQATAGRGRLPTKANPIVGRVAFWTDDDTSKVNINTAGGFTTKGLDSRWDPRGDKSYTAYPGSFWDTPRFFTKFDRGGAIDDKNFGEFQPGDGGLAISQPVANEFQRFPGHPATTSLGLVFNRTMLADGSTDPDNPRLTSQQLYRLLPRFQPGGTKGGIDRQIVNNNTLQKNNMSDKRMPLKAERLYASVDEFFFAQKQLGLKRETTNAFMRTADTSDPRNNIPGMTDDLIGARDLDEFQGYRFFLTAHSNAPELNLYGRPRVSIWPIWAQGPQKDRVDYSIRRNPLDRLMMFCSTVGPLPKAGANQSDVGKLFMFQRWNPYDPHDDVNITRNQDLLRKYLSGTTRAPGLTDLPIPGFTDKATFASKYSNDKQAGSRDQILMSIFDYIRSGVNLRDTYFDRDYLNRTLTTAEIRTRELQRFAPRGIAIPASTVFRGTSVTPPANGGAYEVGGFGRFPTVSEVSIVFYHAGYKDRDGKYFWDPSEKQQRGVTAHLMRMFVMVETFNPMQGYARTEDTSADDRNPGGSNSQASTRPNRLTHVLQVRRYPSAAVNDASGNRMGPQQFTFNGGGLLTNEVRFRSGAFWGGSDAAGMEGCLHCFGRKYADPMGSPADPNGPAPKAGPPFPYPSTVELNRLPMSDANLGDGEYPFQSNNVVEMPLSRAGRSSTETFDFGGMSATLRVRFGQQDLQFINLEFPPAALPVPTDAYWEDPGGFAFNNDNVFPSPSRFNTAWGGRGSDPWACSLLRNPSNPGVPGYAGAMKSLAYRIWWLNEAWPISGRAWSGQFSKYDTQNREINDGNPGRGFRFDNRWRNIIQPGDTVRSLVPVNSDLRVIALTRSQNNAAPDFKELPDYGNATLRHTQPYGVGSNELTSGIARQGQLLRSGGGTPFIFSGTTSGLVTDAQGNSAVSLPAGANGVSPTAACAIEPGERDGVRNARGIQTFSWERKTYGTVGNTIVYGNLAKLPDLNSTYNYSGKAADLPPRLGGRLLNGVTREGSSEQGDFDTGIGSYPDGALCNKPDEGHLIWRVDRSDDDHPADAGVSTDWWYRYPYYISEYTDDPTDTFFSPSRQIPSPVHFGSLLVGASRSWQTLCFSPNPASLKSSTSRGRADHPGFDQDPKDHLLLDLFTMPVVEPYAISEPFSTAGKVNLNCELMPFTYIHRTTALRAALHSTRITAVPTDQIRVNGQLAAYKVGTSGSPLPQNYRLQLNRDETIKSITAIFNKGTHPKQGATTADLFYKSASQICERFLYPNKETDGSLAGDQPGPKWSAAETAIRRFWEKNNLGGDNTREKPYADLYPRLTTKSNTFTVHLRVQKLRPQAGRTDQDFLKWKETEDSVAAEYRGEVQIERYLDPQDRRFDPNDNTVSNDEKFDVDATVYKTNLPATRPLEFAYRFRTISSKRFSPDR